MGIRERFWTWWFDGIPQPVADRLFKRVVSEEVHRLADRLAADNREKSAALDAAQDEIEKRIEDAESLRAAFDRANTEVLKHHERVDAPDPWCQQCSAPPVFAEWPCDPVRAIEDALGGGS